MGMHKVTAGPDGIPYFLPRHMHWHQYWPESLLLFVVVALEGWNIYATSATTTPAVGAGWTPQRKLATRYGPDGLQHTDVFNCIAGNEYESFGIMALITI